MREASDIRMIQKQAQQIILLCLLTFYGAWPGFVGQASSIMLV